MGKGDHSRYLATLLLKVRVDLAVHLVIFSGWMSQGGHSEQLLFFALFYQSAPSCLKVRGGVVGWWGGWPM